MKRLAIVIEYMGTNYSGWQLQKNGISIQGQVETALEKVLQQKVSIFGSGRTDKGVHAEMQVAHFDTESTIAPSKLPMAVNLFLPLDIAVRKCIEVSNDFDARFCASRKIYQYKIYCSRTISPLREQTYAQVYVKPNVEKMKEAARYIVGIHDFKCFMATKSQVASTVRQVFRLDIFEKDDEIIFEIEGNAFLYNMVRIIVGTLINVGYGKILSEEVENIIKSGERNKAGKTFVSKGLTLKKVIYNGINL